MHILIVHRCNAVSSSASGFQFLHGVPYHQQDFPTMARLLRKFTSESVQVIKKMIDDSLTEARDIAKQTKKISRFVLISSIFILGVCLFFLAECC